MDWTNWQTYAALVITIITLSIFARRWVKIWFLNKNNGCGSGQCGCSFKPGKKTRVKD
ncbi:MAG: hypothetical protein ACPIA7_04655 [Akkermansiaceae bacterium]